MAKSIDELCAGLGPTRARELRQARTDREAAQNTLANLQQELATVERELIEAEPHALAVAGVKTATLAKSMAEATALMARRTHLKDVAIPAAHNHVRVTSGAYSSIVQTHQRRTALEAEQQEIIDRAQAKLEDIWQWRAA